MPDQDWLSNDGFETEALGREIDPVLGGEQLRKTAEKGVLVNQDGWATLAAAEGEADGGIELVGLL